MLHIYQDSFCEIIGGSTWKLSDETELYSAGMDSLLLTSSPVTVICWKSGQVFVITDKLLLSCGLQLLERKCW